MSGFESIPVPVLERVTDVHHERNIYAHPNALARAIFWQRLREGYHLLRRHAGPESRVLDLGGGSGAFLLTLARQFRNVAVVDRDLDDARRIAEHYRLSTVRFYEADIAHWTHSETYDVVVAMDVLEHFAEKSIPRRFLDNRLKRGGLLLVSLPTENIFYRLGRIILRKTKPLDHYYPANDLIKYYRDSGYESLADRYVPRIGPLALPLFYVGLFRKL